MRMFLGLKIRDSSTTLYDIATRIKRLITETVNALIELLNLNKCIKAKSTVYKKFENPWTLSAPGYQTSSPLFTNVLAYVIETIEVSDKVNSRP